MKETTKTGAIVSHDLRLCPIVMEVLKHLPPACRVGPIILDEKFRRPFAEHAYAREWRLIARAAKIPDGIRNMDARAGGISEADDAGADLDSIRSAAGHNQASTTARYIRGTIGKSREVAKLRHAHRSKARNMARTADRERDGERRERKFNGRPAIDCDHSWIWSGRSGSNRRHTAWEAVVLPLNYARISMT